MGPKIYEDIDDSRGRWPRVCFRLDFAYRLASQSAMAEVLKA